MDVPVFLLLQKARMPAEVILPRMFKDEISPRVKDIPGKYLVRNGRKILKRIRRICKDYIEFFPADVEKLKDIVTHDSQILQTETGRLRSDEIGMQGEHFDAIDHRGTSGGELKGYGACSAKKVKDLKSLQLIFIIKNVEQSLLSKIGSRPGLISARRLDSLTLEFSTYYSHIRSALHL